MNDGTCCRGDFEPPGPWRFATDTDALSGGLQHVLVYGCKVESIDHLEKFDRRAVGAAKPVVCSCNMHPAQTGVTLQRGIRTALYRQKARI